MVATLEEGEDASEAAKKLQARAEGLVEDHKRGLLQSIEELYQLTERQKEMIGLERQLKAAQDRMDQIRKDWPMLKAPETEPGSDQCELLEPA